MFVSEDISTFFCFPIICLTNSVIIVVFPVPGGPWIINTSGALMAPTYASACLTFAPKREIASSGAISPSFLTFINSTIMLPTP